MPRAWQSRGGGYPARIVLGAPAERIDLTIKALPKAILATPADMEVVKADPERREQVVKLIDAQLDRLRALRIQLDTELRPRPVR